MGCLLSVLRRCWPLRSRSSPTKSADVHSLSSNPAHGPGVVQPISSDPPFDFVTEPNITPATPVEVRECRRRAKFVNAVYYASWTVHDGHTPETLNLDGVSHLFYAFAKLDSDGSLILGDKHTDLNISVDGTKGCVRALQRLKRDKYPMLRIILSVGGETSTTILQQLLGQRARTEQFFHSAERLVNLWGLDGIDMEWKPPTHGQDAWKYTYIFSRLRTVLPSPRYILSTSVPAQAWSLLNMNLGASEKFLDMINVRAYDFVGPLSGINEAGHHAQLRCPAAGQSSSVAAQMSGESAICSLIGLGVPRAKLVLGVPLYGRAFPGATKPGPWVASQGEKDGGIIEYRHLPVKLDDENDARRDPDPDAITPCAEQYDPVLAAAWCRDPNGEAGRGFISYDNEESVEAKALYVKDEGLGGLFYWHISFDKPSGQGSLVDVGAEVLNVGSRNSIAAHRSVASLS